MSWHYRIRKRIVGGDPWFDVVEYHVVGKLKGWTEIGLKPEGATRKEVIRCLEMMLKDAKKRRTLFDGQ